MQHAVVHTLVRFNVRCKLTLFVVFLFKDYLNSLGKARTAQVQRDARIGEAQYKRDAVIRV